MFKNIFITGLLASIFGTIISVSYINIFKFSAYEADFTEKASILYLLSFNVMNGMFACFLYFAMAKMLKKEKYTSFFVGFILSGLAIFLALKFIFTVDPNLVFKNESAEAAKDYFYILLAPIAFFPALSWFTFKPLIIK